MKISIAVCTWNRCRLLRQTIESMESMNVPDSLEWEIIVVDNNSTDQTRQVVESFRDRLPIRYGSEAVQGHSASRNRAIDLARSHASDRYIIWTDNDVVVDTDWLVAYARGFSRHPEAVFFGGRIVPAFEIDQPQWLVKTWEKCQAVYAARDLGNSEIQLGNGVFPYGANFAVRADVQNEFRFDTSRGRNARNMLGDDEISVLRRMDSAGHQGVWLPDASLQHIVPADRATTRYVGQYFVGQGQMNILQNKVQKSVGQAFREYLRNQFAYLWKRRFKKPDEWVSHLIRASLSRGEYIALKQKQNDSEQRSNDRTQEQIAS